MPANRSTVSGARSIGGAPSVIHAASISPSTGEIESPATLQPLAKKGHRGDAVAVLANRRPAKDRQLVMHVVGGSPQHFRVEWHVADLELRARIVAIEEERILFVHAPQKPAVARAQVDGRVHDADHRQVRVCPRDRFRDEQLLASRHERHPDPAGLGHPSRPRTRRVDHHRRLDPAAGGLDTIEWTVSWNRSIDRSHVWLGSNFGW